MLDELLLKTILAPHSLRSRAFVRRSATDWEGDWSIAATYRAMRQTHSKEVGKIYIDLQSSARRPLPLPRSVETDCDEGAAARIVERIYIEIAAISACAVHSSASAAG